MPSIRVDLSFVEDFDILDPYKPIYTTHKDADVYLIWGGRDSGKSHNITPILLDKLVHDSYFKCVVVRNVFDTIRDSCFSKLRTYKEEIEHADKVFRDTSAPLELAFMPNGNKFIARGCDKPAKLKSIDDPSCVWIEEADQIPESAYDIINTTLRANVRTQQFLTFNPEVDTHGESWIYNRFFKNLVEAGIDIYQPLIEFDIDIELESGETVTKRCVSIHTTCIDNPYCTPARRAELESYRNIDLNKYNVWFRGRWGRKDVKRPFAHAFNRGKHISDVEIEHDPKLPVYLSFDFNVDPITCIAAQHKPNGIGTGVILREFRLLNSDIYELCEQIAAAYPGSFLIITGDASGSNRSAMTKGALNYYTIIKSQLRIGPTQIKVPNINPSIKNSRLLVNTVLERGRIVLNPSCRYLADDLSYVECTETGDIDKNKDKHLSHLLDTFRYYLDTFHSKFLQIQ